MSSEVPIPDWRSTGGSFGPARGEPDDLGRERDACGIGFVAHERGERSHRILALALEALAGLDHRGAVSADGRTSDGTGVLLHLPHALLWAHLEHRGVAADGLRDRDLAVAMCFLPREETATAIRLVEREAESHGLRVLDSRTVPTNPEVLGEKARQSRPAIVQVILARPAGIGGSESSEAEVSEAFERRLFLCRRGIEKAARREGIELTIASLSSRTVVYKSMARAADVPRFYPDLADPRVETGVAVFHQRFSTNTTPSWRLAQPFRMLAHNGEINTIRGNQYWMTSREAQLTSTVLGADLPGLLPLLNSSDSDSAMLDRTLELLVRAGRDPVHALAMMVPASVSAQERRSRAGLDDDGAADFYRFHRTLLEPWDGPAALVATDGRVAVAALDRNGLRPQRLWRTADGIVIIGSESGMVSLDDAEIVEKGRLGPGQMLAVDLEGDLDRAVRDPDAPARRFFAPAAVHRLLATSGPWRKLLDATVEDVAVEPAVEEGLEDAITEPADEDGFQRLQIAFGWSKEALERIIDPMLEGKVPVGSMGNDAPLAVLSEQPQLLYSYFKQRFAQVTNPPVDPYRERTAFDLDVYVGAWGNLLDDPRTDPPAEEESAAIGLRLLRFPSPVLSPGQLAALRSRAETPTFRLEALDCSWPVADGVDGLRPAVERLADEAEAAVREGAVVLVLTDRADGGGVGPERAPIPMLLATAAVHHRLLRVGIRLDASLICDSAEPREDHHAACLIGFGATLVCPWMAYETVRRRALERDLDPGIAMSRYRSALETGLLKVLSRLGVGPMTSYHGAQLFEALGLDPDLIDRWFPGTTSRIGGVGPRVLADDALRLHLEAFGDLTEEGSVERLPDRGFFRFRREGESHDFEPGVFTTLHKAVRRQDSEVFGRYAEMVDRGRPTRLRHLLGLRAPERPMALEEVEPASTIARRFVTAAMSLGALSPEAHQVLAIGMNRVGGRSNSGEGGEDEGRFRPWTAENLPKMAGAWQPEPGDWANSAIKQIASGRFGVTPFYLRSARELEIKMAQGSKPGEGGQIPGHKVTVEIARLRRAVPGMPLVSPPPHHDIYSIEDLGQLIYDLKRVNPEARIGVKLVSVAGVGTIACGVAKAGADYIQISGDDGGTGASPLSSIKHAGMPWELGLAEAQRALVASGLRGRVGLRVDGGLKTGRDVLVGALLGAEEFGFGTAPLVAIGCVMARQCHLDTCPVGIATQREELRSRFPGTPDRVVSFMLFVAEQVRHELARIGLRTLDEAVGRFDLLVSREERAPVRGLSLDRMIRDPDPEGSQPRRGHGHRNPLADEETSLDQRLFTAFLPALEEGRPARAELDITHCDRSVGARISGEVARRTEGRGLPPGTLRADLRGAAGQSFGAWLAPGIELDLEGEAQDYVGKGMAGGRLVLRPPAAFVAARGEPAFEQVIAGNTLLYGATGGELFAGGRVGERFAVRNSGAAAVVEGCGDHGCEYMTAGCVVILSGPGSNFGAGMGGGTAWIWDPDRRTPSRVHPESVVARSLDERVLRSHLTDEIEELERLLALHAERTGSPRARWILGAWPERSEGFVVVLPKRRDKDLAARLESLPAGPDDAAATLALDG